MADLLAGDVRCRSGPLDGCTGFAFSGLMNMQASKVTRNARWYDGTMNCRECGERIGIGGARGPRPSYCTSACKQRAYRRRKRENRIPERLVTLARWTRADGKRPIQTNGKTASSTNPATWTTHKNATKATAGDGLGFMLGDGVVCIALDHALTTDGQITPTAQRVLDACPGAWVETSVSGRGLHVFGTGFERAGRRFTAADGTGVECYARARFIRVTGNTYRAGGLPVLDLDAAMTAARKS